MPVLPVQTDIYTLHVDDLALDLVPGVDPDKLTAELEQAMLDGRTVHVAAQDSALDRQIAVVRPSNARVVYISRRSLLVPLIGKPSGG